MERESVSDVNLVSVVDLMYHDVTCCQSVSNPEPKDIVVHGGNGYCGSIASALLKRLGPGYSVEPVADSNPEFVDGRYYLDVEWYLGRVRNG